MRNIAIDADRLWGTLMEIGRIGETPGGGSHRLALTAEDGEARDLFRRWMREAGCAVSIDAIGNIFARREGRDPSLPPVMVGSHLDTVPMGGKFDGIAGVMAGVELLRTLNDRAIATTAPIEIVVWTNEEGSRYSPFTMGSQVFAGQQRLADMLAGRDVLDPAHGDTVGEALTKIGYAGTVPVGGRPVGCYFELHVEQGPSMMDADVQIGIVVGSFVARYFIATIVGEQAHVGPTPMAQRKDALVAMSRLVLEIDRIGRAHGPDGRSNAPHLELYPNVRGVIPARIELSCDVRHSDHATMLRMEGELRAAADRVAAASGVAIGLRQYHEFGPVRFHPDAIDLLRRTSTDLGYRTRDILTIAGHDAVPMLDVCPSGMVFVASRADGISHNEKEFTNREDLAAGTNVMLHAVLARAGVVD